MWQVHDGCSCTNENPAEQFVSTKGNEVVLVLCAHPGAQGESAYIHYTCKKNMENYAN